MKKKLLIFIISLLIILVVVQPTILTEFWWKIKYSVGGYFIDKKYEVREAKAREKNREAAEKWVVSKYGEAVAKVVEIEYDGKSEGWVDWSTFKMTAPFAVGWIVVNSEDQSIVSGGFDLEGPTFQHLYSEWVKKQVGIDDENVEFGFTGSYDTPYVEFDKITTLSEDYREVFENTHRFYLDTIKDKNSRINEKNYIDFFYNIKNDMYIKSSYITGKPNKPYSLFVYIDNYKFIYNFPEEEIAIIRKNNEKIELTSMLNYQKK